MTLHPSLLRRKIIHVDMDAFYASIEVLDEPSLIGKPLVVGGSPQSRGVVCTASYEARKFGIHSAMACAKAARLCPQAIFVRPRFDRYQEISEDIRAIFHRYTNLVEPLSLDEAYLDVTDHPDGLYAVEIAKRIRQEIKDVTGLTASAGVAPNKLVAKIASDVKKPDGLTVVLPAAVFQFMQTLPVRRINGIGPVSAARLSKQGIEVCADVLKLGLTTLVERYGQNFGVWLYEGSQGVDEREVRPSRVRKSVGQETTFAKDLTSAAAMATELEELAQSLAEYMQTKGYKGRTVTLKVRYPDFNRATRALTLAEPTNDEALILQTALELLPKTDACTKTVRLLGITVSKLVLDADNAPMDDAQQTYKQLSLFGD